MDNGFLCSTCLVTVANMGSVNESYCGCRVFDVSF